MFACSDLSLPGDFYDVIIPLFTSNVPYFQVRDVRLIMDRNSRRSKGVGYVFYCQIISCSYVCAIVVLGYQHPRIMFNCIFKWTSNAIMMRDDGGIPCTHV